MPQTLITFALAASMVFAADGKSIVPLIEKANEAVEMNPPADCPNCAYSAGREGKMWEKFSACFKKICPQVDLNQSYGIVEDAANAKRDAEAKPLREALENLIAAKVEEETQVKKYIADFISGKVKVPTSMEYAVDDFVTSYRDLFPVAVDEILSGRKTEDKMISDYLLAEGKTPEVAYKSTLNTALKGWIADKRAMATGMRKYGSAYQYKFIYPNDDLQTAARRDLRETQRALERAPKTVRNLIQASGVEEDLRLRAKLNSDPNKLIDEVEAAEILKTTDRVQLALSAERQVAKRPAEFKKMTADSAEEVRGLMSTNLEAAGRKLEEPPVPLDEGVAAKGLTELTIQDAQSMAGNGTPFNRTTRTYIACVNNIMAGASVLPSRKEIEQFRKGLPKIRASVKAGLKGKLSAHTSKLVDKYVDDVQFMAPPARDGFLKDAVSVINQSAAKSRRAVKALKADPERGALMMSALGDNDGASIMEDLQKTCENLTYRQVRDNTIATLGAVSVGSASVTHSHFGHGVCAHEIGHGVFNILEKHKGTSAESKKKFADAKKCLSDLHKPLFEALGKMYEGKEPHQRDIRNPEHYVGEDFADLVSGASTPGPNFWCSPGAGYMLDSTAPETWADTDRHSQEGFRMFNIEANSTREFAGECNDFLKESGYELKKCL